MVTIRVDVTKPVLDWDGVTELHHQTILAGEIVDMIDAAGDPKVFTVRHAITKALTNLLPSEKEAGDHPPELKDDIFRVMCVVAANDQAELDDTDRVLIESRSRENCNALIHGRIGQAFEAGEKVEPSRNGKGKVDKLAEV